MVLKRIMPCLLLRRERLVKTINFQNPDYIGDPINAIKIYNDKEVDELVLLDIQASKDNTGINFDLIQDCASECFMPLAYGGGVKTIDDFRHLYKIGIEKVIVNSLLFDNPAVVEEAVGNYGSQSVVASLDVKKVNKSYKIYSHLKDECVLDLKAGIEKIIKLGVGELLLTSVDREGTWDGYDGELLAIVQSMISIPIIANGGCGAQDDLKEILYGTGCQAAAIGSMAVYQKKNMGVLIKFPRRSQIISDEQVF